MKKIQKKNERKQRKSKKQKNTKNKNFLGLDLSVHQNAITDVHKSC